MPIAFPRPSGHTPIFYRDAGLIFRTPAWAVPTPNFGRVGTPLSDDTLNPGLPMSRLPGASGGGAAANVRRFGTVYADVQVTAIQNPQAVVGEGRVLNDRRVYDRVQGFKTGILAGVSRDSTGAALGNCRVMIFRTAVGVGQQDFVGETTSDGSGNWSFGIMESGPFFLVEYIAGSPDRAGTSLNTLAPVYTDV